MISWVIKHFKESRRRASNDKAVVINIKNGEAMSAHDLAKAVQRELEFAQRQRKRGRAR